MYRLRCDYVYSDSDCKQSETSIEETSKLRTPSTHRSNQSVVSSRQTEVMGSSSATMKKVDIVFSNTRKTNDPVHQDSKRSTTDSKRAIRSAYRRSLVKQSSEALAFLSSCNAELETEMFFLTNELEAFRLLERSQHAEMVDLKRYAPQADPPPPKSPECKASVVDEAPSRPLRAAKQAALHLPHSTASTAPHPPALSPPTSAAKAAQVDSCGPKDLWRGGCWKKALRKRS